MSADVVRSRWWRLLAATFVVLVIGTDAVARPPPRVNPAARSYYDPPTDEDHAYFLSQMRQILQLVKDHPELEQQWNDAQEKASELDSDELYVPWICPSFPPSTATPTSVHALRPGDIKVIGALGDSITGGFGVRAETPIQIMISNRGESWSIGGERSLEHGVLTLPNILRHFNPDIKGASYCRPRVSDDLSGLNVAVGGATNRGMVIQAEELMLRMLEDPEIDYWNDWKIVTIFIGGNDLCRFCQAYDQFSAEAYYNGIKATLDLFYTHLPRAIINLQAMLDISMVKDLIHPGSEELCAFLHQFMCPCNAKLYEMQRGIQLEYYDKMVLLADGRYDNRSDFTVVLQPHMKDLVMLKNPDGTYDMSFIAPDCFHPSHKSHQAFAYMMWNTMLTPVGSKTTNYSLSTDATTAYKCPSDAKPYIYTNCNSNKPEACGLNTQTSESGMGHVTSGPMAVIATALITAFVALYRHFRFDATSLK